MSTVIHPYAKLRANVRLSYLNTYLFYMHKFYYITLQVIMTAISLKKKEIKDLFYYVI